MVLDHVGCAVGVRDDLLDEKPAVVEERVRRSGRNLLHAPVEMVVAVGDDRDEAVEFIVVSEIACKISFIVKHPISDGDEA